MAPNYNKECSRHQSTVHSWTPVNACDYNLQQLNHLVRQNFPSFENQRLEKEGRPQGKKIHFIMHIPIYFAQIFPVFHFHDEHPKVDRMKRKGIVRVNIIQL